jgi:UPF0755 protein
VSLLLFLAVLAAAGVAGKQWLMSRLGPVASGSSESVLVVVPSGASTREVADLLFAGGVIKDPTFFRYYAQYKKVDAQLQGGEYELSRSMTPDEILAKLSRGEVVVRRFTVPEGLTVAELADLLAGKKLVEREAFLAAAAASKLNAAHLPDGVALTQPLEGYLFPSTYDYKPGITAEQILAMMYARWEDAFEAALRQRGAKPDLTVHELMTLASIIEEEAQVAEERPVISGVYMNRLAIGMKLDADPTVRYGLAKDPKEELRLADLQIESPYNTYLQAGLPPGPIAAPGQASIEAALSPQKHDFWYFVAKADGSGQHYFASTLDEQTANIEKAAANAKK